MKPDQQSDTYFRNLLHDSQAIKIAIILIISSLAAISSAPSSSKGYQEYVYDYHSQIIPQSTSDGFSVKARIHYEILYATNHGPLNTSDSDINLSPRNLSNWLVRLRVSRINFNKLDDNDSKLGISDNHKDFFKPEYYVYAHLVCDSNGRASIKDLYAHHSDSTLYKNLKKSMLLNLIPSDLHLRGLGADSIVKNDAGNFFQHDNSLSQPEMFSPHATSSVYIFSKSIDSNDHVITTLKSLSKNDIDHLTIFDQVEGMQNVTFKSRVFPEAQSNVTTNFRMKLYETRPTKNHVSYEKARYIESAIKIMIQDLADQYEADNFNLERHETICSSHHCMESLSDLVNFYKLSLQSDSGASVEASIAYLRILDRIRNASGTEISTIMSILNKNKSTGIRAAFVDILAAARTKNSIKAALKHLRLAENSNLDIAERFLIVLGVAAKTISKMHLKQEIESPYDNAWYPPLKLSQEAREQGAKMASLDFIINELLSILNKSSSKKWKSHKLRWSTLLTLGTIVNAYHEEKNYTKMEDNALSNLVNELLLNELLACQDSNSPTDCHIVILQAIGNVGYLGMSQYEAIEDFILGDGRRESVVAMKILRDLLTRRSKSKPFTREFHIRLKELFLRVIYDNTKETTARVIASELMVRFNPNTLAIEQLIENLSSFKNRELATMIYTRVASLISENPQVNSKLENWYWQCCVTNGTSSSFIRTMAKTESLNASYGVNVELLNGQKMLKESSFDVFLDTKQRTQDLFSLEIFARGLTNIPMLGNDQIAQIDDSAEDPTESLMAGMSLKLLGGYLRPYIFFSSYYELGMHLFWGTAKSPITAFSGNLMLIDHNEGQPLITGFVVEQQMRGVLSIDVMGKAEASLMSGSHSVVRTKAAIIVQASQSIFTTYKKLWLSNLFSFGGQASIDFIADASWSSKPYEMCLQVTQPKFLIRLNERRKAQMMTDDVMSKIKRRNFHIGAKSYPLNSENNKMCSSMLKNDRLMEYDPTEM